MNASQRFLDAIGRPAPPSLSPAETADFYCRMTEVDAAVARRYGTENETADQARDRIAQQAAEYIVGILLPRWQRLADQCGATVIYPGREQAPTDVAAIKASLLFGEVWGPWLDERVSLWTRQLADLRS